MNTLVICEKLIAARRIADILSDRRADCKFISKVPVFTFEKNNEKYTVIGLRGHIVTLDYPAEYNDWFKVPPKELIYAKQIKKQIAPSIVKVLKSVAKDCDFCIISTDYDREGELIGLEALEFVKSVKPDIVVKRARFSAITKTDINNAFSNLAEVDYNLAAAAETRQIVDLTWGAVLTRFISIASKQVGKDFLSVGRVQTPTLSLIVEKDSKIRDFKPRDYYDLIAKCMHDRIEFNALHEKNPFWKYEDAAEIYKKIKTASTAKVLKVESKQKYEWGPVPFNTTTFLAECSKLGIDTAYAMKLAETLYTNGLISYPRTDNATYPQSLNLRYILEKLLESDFKSDAEKLLQQEIIKPTKGKTAQDHPPIHPVGSAKKTDLKKDLWRVYELVVRRFFATLAPPARVKSAEITVEINGELFVARGYEFIDKGWYEYYPYSKRTELKLPALEENAVIAVSKIRIAQETTKPPRRYTQGTLIAEMTTQGLGTKSTRHEIIQKLYERNYVYGRNLIPTQSGVALIESLKRHAEIITKPDMTATLESEMNDITMGTKMKDSVVSDSQKMLTEVVSTLDAHGREIGDALIDALRLQQTVGKCRCGGELVLRSGATKFIGCTNYPACKITYPLPKYGNIAGTGKNCEKCGAPVLTAIGRTKTYTFCADPNCVSNAKISIGTCECGGRLEIVKSRKGKRFAGCSNYPTCTKVYPLPQRGRIIPLNQICKKCSAPLIKVVEKGKKDWLLCVNIDCRGK